MADTQRENKFKQIFGNLIAYSIYVFLGSTALVFSHKLWLSFLEKQTSSKIHRDIEDKMWFGVR